MQITALHLGLCVAVCGAAFESRSAPSLPPKDLRAATVRDLNTPRTFPAVASKAAWQARAKDIREQILVSCGLYPFPEQTPLNEKITGRIERDGYAIEKVVFESFPGVFVAGNLYRPLGQGTGPFPGVLNPHGHWGNGRMADEANGSIAGRCINFAKAGMVAFTYDMFGYNDTMQFGPHRSILTDGTAQLWGLNLMGLQTYNSLRALMFLMSLPDVDPARLGCTGESGGGTQTFMLGAIADNVAVQAPIVMVSHSMQGGCLCENAPGLRVEYSNMEIAAVPAPRPQILVAASGDWTKTTMTIEGPGIAGVYRHFAATNRLRYVLFDFPHNYNKATREAVYPWFEHWLSRAPLKDKRDEFPFKKEPDTDLRVFPGTNAVAPGAITEAAFIQSRINEATAQLAALRPHDKRSLQEFKDSLLPLWKHTLQLQFPPEGLVVEKPDPLPYGAYTVTRIALGRDGRGDRLPAALLTPKDDKLGRTVILAHPDGKSPFLAANGAAQGLARQLVLDGCAVLVLDTFLTGELSDAAASASRIVTRNYFATYNRTDLQERVQDLVTAAAYVRADSKSKREVVLCGVGRAGLWALLAAPAADAVIADCDTFDATSDAALLAPDFFAPGFRRMGGFETAALLAAPNPLVLHNSGDHFPYAGLRGTYTAIAGAKVITVSPAKLSDDDLVKQSLGLKLR
jgi:dienelactone hydrolase